MVTEIQCPGCGRKAALLPGRNAKGEIVNVMCSKCGEGTYCNGLWGFSPTIGVPELAEICNAINNHKPLPANLKIDSIRLT